MSIMSEKPGSRKTNLHWHYNGENIHITCEIKNKDCFKRQIRKYA